MIEQEENRNENTAADDSMRERAEEAKHERQQPNGNKKNIYVEFTGKYYIVKNEGDAAALYESEDKEASLDFANKVAEEHNVKVILDERIDKEEDKSDQPAGEGRREHGEKRRYRERREDEEGPRNVIIEDDGKYYIVRNDGDKAKLYESRDKKASLDFARKVAKDHEVDLVMLDRDSYIVLEESYNNREAKEQQEQDEASSREHGRK